MPKLGCRSQQPRLNLDASSLAPLLAFCPLIQLMIPLLVAVELHQCKGSQVWDECNNPCAPTCAQPEEPESCIEMCVAGCGCPNGGLLHDEGCAADLDGCPSNDDSNSACPAQAPGFGDGCSVDGMVCNWDLYCCCEDQPDTCYHTTLGTCALGRWAIVMADNWCLPCEDIPVVVECLFGFDLVGDECFDPNDLTSFGYASSAWVCWLCFESCAAGVMLVSRRDMRGLLGCVFSIAT